MDVPEGWWTQPGPQHGYEVRSYDPTVALAGNATARLPAPAGVVLTLRMRQNPKRLDPLSYFKKPDEGPELAVREHEHVELAGQPAEMWLIWRDQPSNYQWLEPTRRWYVRSPFFDDRMVVITAAPGDGPLQDTVDRVLGTLQFYRPTPPPLDPIVTRDQAVRSVLEDETRSGAAIDRVEAKLVLYKEFETALAAGQDFVTDPDTLVWLVVYEGSSLSCGAGPRGSCRSSFRVVAARPSDHVAMGGAAPAWPAWFDALRDRDPAP